MASKITIGIPQNLMVSTLALSGGIITSAGTLTISTAASNANVIIAPNGTGQSVFSGSTSVSATPRITFLGDVDTGLGHEGGDTNRFFITAGGGTYLGFYGNNNYMGAFKHFISVSDNNSAISLGAAANRWYQLFLGPTGIKLGDGTLGGTFTVTGSGTSEALVLTSASAGSIVLTAATSYSLTFDSNGAIYPSAGSVGLGRSTLPFSLLYVGGSNGPAAIYTSGNASNANLILAPNGTGKVLLPGTANLQFGATAAATIGVSADTTAGVLTITPPSAGSTRLVGEVFLNSGSALAFNSAISGANIASIYSPAAATGMIYNAGTIAGVHAFQSSTTTFLTLGGTSGASSITGGAGNMTILAGTGASRTLTFQTTSGVSAAQTNAVFNADLSSTWYGSLITSGAASKIQFNGGQAGIGAATTSVLSLNDTTNTVTSCINVGTANTIIFRNAANSATLLTLAPAGVTNYANVATAGWGVPAIYGAGTVSAQTVRSAAVATYTVGAADGTFEVGGNVNVTTSTTHSFSLDVEYTDESNTARTLILPMASLGGSYVSGGLITNVTGAGPYSSSTLTIRCKAATSITIRPSAGTFTSVTYNAAAVIQQTA